MVLSGWCEWSAYLRHRSDTGGAERVALRDRRLGADVGVAVQRTEHALHHPPVDRADDRVLDGDVWVPPDVDLSASADPETTKLRDRLVTLTPQQVRVLMMLSEGLLNKQIAYELGVSEATIKAHVSAILQKLGVESRTQAVIAAAKISGSQWRQEEPIAS